MLDEMGAPANRGRVGDALQSARSRLFSTARRSVETERAAPPAGLDFHNLNRHNLKPPHTHLQQRQKQI